MTHQIVYELEGEEVVFPLEGDEVVIGRDGDLDLVIKRPSISRRHARLYRDGNAWRIADEGSLNGTRVNDVQQNDVLLRNGDRIMLHDFPLTFVDTSAPRVSLTAQLPESDPGTGSHTVFQETVDFAALASEPADPAHLQRLLRVVTRVSEVVLASATLDETFANVLDLVFEHLPVQRGFIMLWDKDRENLVPHCVKHRIGAPKDGSDIQFSRTIAEKVCRDKVTVLTKDAQSDERFASGQSVFELDIRSAMAAPLWNKDNVDGLIYVDTLTREAFDKFDLDLLSALGNHLAVAIERARLQDSVVKQQLVRRRLERYHSPAVAERIARSSEGGGEALMAEVREVTVLFADVVGFTTRCEGMEPREVADLLNRYFSEMAEMIFKHDGTLDKFIGDCLMAVFGAPLASEDHAERAAAAALDMRLALDQLNQPLPEEERLRFRVGMHSGSVVAGDIGSVRRSDYTVLGATVNLASRLEATVAGPGQIVLSEAVNDLLDPRFETRFVGEHQPKGTLRPIRCFELVGRRNDGIERTQGSRG